MEYPHTKYILPIFLLLCDVFSKISKFLQNNKKQLLRAIKDKLSICH